MAKAPKARGKNGDATLADVVAKELEWAGRSAEASLWLAASLHASNQAEHAETLAGSIDAVVAAASRAPEDAYENKTSSFRALEALGKIDEAKALLEGMLSTRDPRSCTNCKGILLGMLASADRFEEVLELLGTVDGSDAHALVSTGRAGVAALSAEQISQVISLLEESWRSAAAGEIVGAMSSPTVAKIEHVMATEEIDPTPLDRAALLHRAGFSAEAKALVPDEPAEGEGIRWFLLRYELGMLALGDALTEARELFGGDHVGSRARPLVLVLAEAARRRDDDEKSRDAICAHLDEAWAGTLSKYDEGVAPGIQSRQLAVQAHFAHAAGDVKAAAKLLKEARTVATRGKPHSKAGNLSVVLSEEVAMGAPLEAYRTAKKIPKGNRTQYGGKVAVAYLPDIAGALLAIEALVEIPAHRSSAVRDLAMASLSLDR